jgi:hypothetical protein
LSSPGFNTGGSFVFTLNGTAGQILVLQSSTSLIVAQWTSRITNSVSGGGINFTDTATTNYPNQFHRGKDVTP